MMMKTYCLVFDQMFAKQIDLWILIVCFIWSLNSNDDLVVSIFFHKYTIQYWSNIKLERIFTSPEKKTDIFEKTASSDQSIWYLFSFCSCFANKHLIKKQKENEQRGKILTDIAYSTTR